MNAIAANFADFKLIKTRGVAQLVMEVPIEDADAALALLGGVPQPGRERGVGIAPLPTDGDRVEATPEKPVDSERPGDRPAPSDCDHDWRIWPETDGQEQRCSKCRIYRRTPTDGERLRTRAVMLCKDERFQEWVCDKDNSVWPENEEWHARAYLNHHCGIDSRSELATDPEAQKKFLLLEAQYRAEVGMLEAQYRAEVGNERS